MKIGVFWYGNPCSHQHLEVGVRFGLETLPDCTVSHLRQ